MKHDKHLSSDNDRGGPLTKLVTLAGVLLLLLGCAGYVVYGSGMWK
jgi:hypothetical protein